MSNYVVVCDGGKKKDLAYGSYKVFDSQGKEIAHHQLFFGFGTSNTSEYLAFLNAIRFCKQQGLDNILFKSDSLLMVNQVLGKYKTKNKILKKLRVFVLEELKELKDYRLIHINNKKVKKILGH